MTRVMNALGMIVGWKVGLFHAGVEVHGEEVQFVAQGDQEDGGTGIKCTLPLLVRIHCSK